jgi:hypothetical protein
LSLIITAYAIFLSLLEGFASTKKIKRLWKTRHLRKVWGIKDGDSVIIVCSELEEPEERQNVEPPREFIYSFKYGDLDAYIQVVVTVLRLFPNVKLRVMSSGEAQNAPIDLAHHLILVGGPDYNAMTARILKMNVTQVTYRSPYLDQQSKQYPKEIVLYHTVLDCESCYTTKEHDFGYFERIKNPNNPASKIILLGGCHTIGVTGAVKAFSMFENEQGEISKLILKNARTTAKKISRNSEFAVTVDAELTGQTIPASVVHKSNIAVRNVGWMKAAQLALAQKIRACFHTRDARKTCI